MSAYTVVSLQSLADVAQDQPTATPEQAPAPAPECSASSPLEAHPAWDRGSGWKHHLNNLRLLLQPHVSACLLVPWLALVPLPHVQAVQRGLAAIGALVNTFHLVLPT